MDDYSLEFKQSVVSDFNCQRYTVEQISRRHGVPEGTIYRWVRQHKGGVLSESKRGVYTSRGRLTEEQVSDILNDYTKNKIGTTKIASKHGVTHGAIIKVLKKHGVYEGAEGASERRSKLPPDKFNELTELYTTTHIPLAELASKFDVTEMYIKGFAHHYKLRRPSGQKAKRITSVKYQLSEQVTADYKTGEYSHKTLAEKYGVSTRTISRILDSAGVEAIGGKKLASATEVADKMDDVVSLADQGKGVFDIAADTGMSVGTVKHILENDKREKERAENTSKTRIAELHSQGLMLKDIADKADMPIHKARKILEELGLELNSPAEKHKELVSSLARSGKSAKDIALEVGISIPTVRKLLAESGISLKDIARERKEDNPVDDKREQRNSLVMKCVAEGLTVNEIAQKVGISIPTVRKVLADNGVELNRGKPILQGSVEKCDETTVIPPEKCEVKTKKSDDGVEVVKARIVELYEQGMEIADIAKELYLNVPIVSIEVNKAMKEGRLHRPYFTDFEKAIIKDMCNQWVTPDHIADKIGCDENYIRRFLQLPDKKI